MKLTSLFLATAFLASALVISPSYGMSEAKIKEELLLQKASMTVITHGANILAEWWDQQSDEDQNIIKAVILPLGACFFERSTDHPDLCIAQFQEEAVETMEFFIQKGATTTSFWEGYNMFNSLMYKSCALFNKIVINNGIRLDKEICQIDATGYSLSEFLAYQLSLKEASLTDLALAFHYLEKYDLPVTPLSEEDLEGIYIKRNAYNRSSKKQRTKKTGVRLANVQRMNKNIEDFKASLFKDRLNNRLHDGQLSDLSFLNAK
jgi:uncharacterized membrane-anchored protein YjiN (DUF445 family)